VGARIWAGHWALSGHYAAKVARLQSAGLDPEKHAANQAEAGHALDRILAEFAFDYALIDRRCPQAIAGLAAHGWRSLETTARWNLLQAPPASP
jgi:hypothetical protein